MEKISKSSVLICWSLKNAWNAFWLEKAFSNSPVTKMTTLLFGRATHLINSDLLTILLMNALSYLPHLSLLLCSPPLLRSNLTHSTLLHRERGTITAGRPLRLNTCLFLIMALWVKTTSFDPYSSNLLNVAFTLVVNQDLLLKYLFNNYNLTFRGLAIVSISYCITDYLLSHQALLWWWRVRESSFNLLPLF